MKTNHTHIIQKVLIDVNTSSLKSGNYFKDNFSKYLNEMLLPLLEKKLDEVNIKTGNYDIRLEELFLNIDLNSIEDFTTIKSKIVPKIEEQIIKRIDKELLGVSDTEIIIKDVQKNQKEFLKEFLTKGVFPWWFSEDQIDLEIMNLFNYVEVTALKNNQFRERLINQFEDFQLLGVVEKALLSIDDISVRKKIESNISKFYNNIYLYKSEIVTGNQRTKIWNIIFSVLIKVMNEKSSVIDLINPLKEFKEEIKVYKNDSSLTNETIEKEIQSRGATFKHQLENINEQLHKILDWLPLIIEDKKTAVFGEEIRNTVSLILQRLSTFLTSENSLEEVKKLSNIFDKQTVFNVSDITCLIETIISFNTKEFLSFLPHKKVSFYTTVNLLTKLSNQIENSKPLKKLVYSSRVKEEIKALSKNIKNEFSVLETYVKELRKGTEIITDEAIQKVFFLLNEKLIKSSSNNKFLKKNKSLAQKRAIHLSDIINLIETILNLKETELLTSYNKDGIEFCKIISLIEKFKKTIQNSSHFEIFNVEGKKKTSVKVTNKKRVSNSNLKATLNKLEEQIDKYFELSVNNATINNLSNNLSAKRNITELLKNKITYLDNAGLILIHPFLKFFFINIGIYDKETKTLTNPEKAAHLLYYISTKQENAFENKMTFEKILCGIPLDQSINRFIKISKKEKEEAENMLVAMLSNWEKMENASPDLLRNEFLQREGKLIINDERVSLKITYKTQDILLNKLNWSISLIKLPWLDNVINVEWC